MRKMNGYSKIKFTASTKSRSIDLSDDSDLLSVPPHHRHQSPNPIESPPIRNHPSKTLETKQIINSSNAHNEDEDGINNGGEKRFFNGGILTRNFSVSSSPSTAANSRRFTLQYSAVKRAFSMRRSMPSSVSERYCRIHDQCVTLDSSVDGGDHDGDQGMEARSVKKKKMMMMKQQRTGGKILKACKRIFGL